MPSASVSRGGPTQPLHSTGPTPRGDNPTRAPTLPCFAECDLRHRPGFVAGPCPLGSEDLRPCPGLGRPRRLVVRVVIRLRRSVREPVCLVTWCAVRRCESGAPRNERSLAPLL